MIQANELRRGNWVKHPHYEKGIVLDMGKHQCNYHQGGIEDELGGGMFVGYQHLVPIPLTPELLEKCGFVKDYNGWHDLKSSFSFSVTKDGKFLPCWYDRVMWPNAYKTAVYLHQLQNLYFALTGEELTIKL